MKVTRLALRERILSPRRIDTGQNIFGDRFNVIERENRDTSFLHLEIGSNGKDGGVFRREWPFMRCSAPADFELWMRLVLEAFGEDDISPVQMPDKFGKRRLGPPRNFGQDRKALRRRDDDRLGACIAILKGILGVGIDIEGVVGVLSGSHIQAPRGKVRDELFDERRLARIFPAHNAKKRGCDGLSLTKELQPKVRRKMRIQAPAVWPLAPELAAER